MFNKKGIFALIIAAAALSGCGGGPKSVPYTGGDACEHAKVVLIKRAQEFDDASHSPLMFVPIINIGALLTDPKVLAEQKLQEARANVNSLCKESEKDGAWACAEGHSCK